jgi:uncharacterized repeat protein (TIGR01451 family)
MNKPHKTMSCAGKSDKWPRQVGLGLVLGLLSVLVLIVTADAYVSKKTETTLVDFDSGLFLYTGLLDLPPRDSVQLLPIGLTGDWNSSGQPLPEPLVNLSTIANGDTIYAIGGTDYEGNIRKEVFSSTMRLGQDLTPWQTATPLPQVRAGAGVAVYPLDTETSMLYVVGGARSQEFDAADTVYRAPIDNATGRVGAWMTDNVHLLDALYYAPVVEHEGALYVIGGYGGTANSVVFDAVQYATINADGSLNSFNTTSPLKEPIFNAVAVVYEGEITDTLYLIGGQNFFTSTFKVYFADFKPDGSLTEWKLSQGNLPIHLWGHAGVLLSGEIILTGGVADSIDPSTGISSTVKAALVDPGDLFFRLYDWCLGVPPPSCTIGAWQSGALLPEVRALHGTATGHGKIYVLGGEDASMLPRDTVFFGTVTGVGALYSPEGQYRSNEIDLGQTARLRRLEWEVTIGHAGKMGLTMQYRYATPASVWSDWSDPIQSVSGTNQLDLDPAPANVRYVQYQANFTTTITRASPLLNWAEIYYEVDDPEVAVRKHTGDKITVTLNNNLDYTIYYTNNGGWVAEGVVLTETLPENTAYTGDPGKWQQIDGSRLYVHSVGNLKPGDHGSITFTTQVASDVPADVHSITNAVEIGYPPMIDAFAQEIVDPKLENNYFEFSNPFLHYAITITKNALPPPGQEIGQGEVITYILTYNNPPRALAATDAYIVDLLPEHTTYVSGSISGPGEYSSDPPRIRWDLGTVEATQNGQVRFSVRVDPACLEGTNLSNMATLYSSAGPPRTSNAVTHVVVESTFNLQAGKDAVPAPGSVVMPGSTITYTLHYTNTGRIPASQAILTDTYDWKGSYTFVSADPPPTPGTNNVWDLGSLRMDDKGSIEVVVQLTDTLPSNWIVTNQARVASPEGAPAYSPVITHMVMNPPGTPLVDLAVGDLRVDPAEPKPGTPVRFYVTLSNEGTLDAMTYFWTGLYIKPWPSVPPSGPSDHDQGYCLNGCTITRTEYIDYAGTLLQGQSMERLFQGDQLIFATEGTYDVYVQTDLAFENSPDNPGYYNPAWGVYPEEDERNNIAHIVVTVGKPKVYMPVVFKKRP